MAASLGNERINEVFDPEIAINRVVNYYHNKGYNDKWIKKRLLGIVDYLNLRIYGKMVALKSRWNMQW